MNERYFRDGRRSVLLYQEQAGGGEEQEEERTTSQDISLSKYNPLHLSVERRRGVSCTTRRSSEERSGLCTWNPCKLITSMHL